MKVGDKVKCSYSSPESSRRLVVDRIYHITYVDEDKTYCCVEEEGTETYWLTCFDPIKEIKYIVTSPGVIEGSTMIHFMTNDFTHAALLVDRLERSGIEGVEMDRYSTAKTWLFNQYVYGVNHDESRSA